MPRLGSMSCGLFATTAWIVGTIHVCAGTMAVTPELRREAVTSCTADVLRICPTTIYDEQRVFACMQANRNQLTSGCRAIFDQGARTVKRY